MKTKKEKPKRNTKAERKQKTSAYAKMETEKELRSKKMIMWSGVSFFMVFIAIVWIVNMKNIFKNNSLLFAAKQENGVSADDFSKNLTKSFSELRAGLNQLKNLQNENQTASTQTQNATDEKIQELKNKLEQSAK